MKNTITMTKRVCDYIIWKRGLGYSQKTEYRELLRFASFAESINHSGPLTTKLAIKWANLADHNSRLYQAKRLELIRCFAKYEAITSPLTEIPPLGIFGRAHIRTQPYIYTKEEIVRLMKRAENLEPSEGLRPRTICTFIGLIASTGMRVCEALKLDCSDIYSEQKIIYIRDTKFHKSRIIPVQHSTIEALQKYINFRSEYHQSTKSTHIFLSKKGEDLPYSTISWNFQQVRKCLLTKGEWNRRPPRMYDLRHTFACNKLLQWYQEGVDINKMISTLSTYLGHVKLSDTYWYLTGTPELFSVVAERFETFACGKQEILS